MDKNDLKRMWLDANYTKCENIFSDESLEKTIGLKHSEAISKSLQDVKLKAILYVLLFFIYGGLMIYALVYLKLNLSLRALLPLAIAGIFLIITATSEFVRLFVLTRTADNLSLKDSLSVFCRKLKKIRTIDFTIYMVLFYLSAILIIISYLADIGGFKNLSWSNEIVPLPLLGVIILMLLSVPWFIRYQNNRRYRELFSKLNELSQQLNDQSGAGIAH
jgi:hypothetical protein